MERTDTAAGMQLSTRIGLLAHGLRKFDLINQHNMRVEEKAGEGQVDENIKSIEIVSSHRGTGPDIDREAGDTSQDQPYDIRQHEPNVEPDSTDNGSAIEDYR